MQETETYIGTEYNMEPERPKFADYFEILGDNENGGMGEVYFCRDKRSGQLYALKKAKADPKYEAVLKQEAAFALELGKHPNIVYTATIGHEGDMYYIVMELIGQTDGPRPQGNTLVNEFNKHPEGLPVEQAYQWAIEFCEGMKYLNSKGMKAHKDIKPANLFITPERHLKIGDFGLASVGENKGIGTKGYRAPEIKNGIYDVRTDIYAFGIVLYQLLNKGFNPLDNTQYTHADTRMDTQDESAFPRADTLKSRHGVDILRKCLQPNPSARYQTFTELEEDLIQALQTLNPQYQFTPAQEEPLNAKEYFGKGSGWDRLQDYHKAIQNYNKAVKLAPKNINVYYNRGLVKGKLQDYSGAIQDYDKAIALDPQNVAAYNNRGIANADLKDYAGAIADYNKTIELDPQNAAAYNNRGIAKANLKNYAGAIEDYNRAIELDPKYANAYNNRGVSKKNTKNFMGSIEDYDKAIELDPKNAGYYNNRGNARIELKDYVNALLDYDKAIELAPREASLYYTRGITKNDIKNYHGAIEDLNKAILLNPQYTIAYNNRGDVKYELGDYVNALLDFDKVISLDPLFATAYNSRGNAKSHLKNFTGAITDYSMAIKLDPQFAFAYYTNRASTKEKINNYIGAIADYQQALSLNPKIDSIYDKLIKCYEKQNQYKKAEEIRRLKQKNCPDK